MALRPIRLLGDDVLRKKAKKSRKNKYIYKKFTWWYGWYNV